MAKFSSKQARPARRRFRLAFLALLLAVLAVILTFGTVAGSAGPATVPAEPVFTGISPATGPILGGIQVTISGKNLTGIEAISFGGAGATSFTVESATTIVAIAPAHSAGTVKVTAKKGSKVSLAGIFTYLAARSAPTATPQKPTTGPTVTSQPSLTAQTSSPGPTATPGLSATPVMSTPINASPTAASATPTSVLTVAPTAEITGSPVPATTQLNPTSTPVPTEVDVSPAPTVTQPVASPTPTVTETDPTPALTPTEAGNRPTPTLADTVIPSPATATPTVAATVAAASATPGKSKSGRPTATPKITPARLPLPRITAPVTPGAGAGSSTPAPDLTPTPVVTRPVITNTLPLTPTVTPATPGALSIISLPATINYSGQLDGANLVLTSQFSIGVADATGSNQGWHLLMEGGLLRSNQFTIPPENHTIQSVVISNVRGVAPRNLLQYPRIIPVQTDSIFSAAENSGTGQATLTFLTRLLIPAEAPAGAYNVGFNFTIASGP